MLVKPVIAREETHSLVSHVHQKTTPNPRYLCLSEKITLQGRNEEEAGIINLSQPASSFVPSAAGGGGY